jgi:chemotaxis response regulator CheB
MSGMPQSAIAAGVVHEVAPLDGIIRLIGDFVAKAGL